MQMMNLGETSDPDNHYHCSERELVRSDSHVMQRTRYVASDPAVSLHFHQFKGYILPASQKPGSK